MEVAVRRLRRDSNQPKGPLDLLPPEECLRGWWPSAHVERPRHLPTQARRKRPGESVLRFQSQLLLGVAGAALPRSRLLLGVVGTALPRRRLLLGVVGAALPQKTRKGAPLVDDRRASKVGHEAALVDKPTSAMAGRMDHEAALVSRLT